MKLMGHVTGVPNEDPAKVFGVLEIFSNSNVFIINLQTGEAQMVQLSPRMRFNIYGLEDQNAAKNQSSMKEAGRKLTRGMKSKKEEQQEISA